MISEETKKQNLADYHVQQAFTEFDCSKFICQQDGQDSLNEAKSKLESGTSTSISAENEHITESFKRLDVLAKKPTDEAQEKEKGKDMNKSILNPVMMGLNTPEHDLEHLKEFERISSSKGQNRIDENEKNKAFLISKCKDFAKYLALSELLNYVKLKTDQELEADLKKSEGEENTDSQFMKWRKEKASWIDKYIEQMADSMKLEESLKKRSDARKALEDGKHLVPKQHTLTEKLCVIELSNLAKEIKSNIKTPRFCHQLIDELINNDLVQELSKEEMKQGEAMSSSQLKIQSIASQLVHDINNDSAGIDVEEKIKVNLNMAALTGNVTHMLNVLGYLMKNAVEELKEDKFAVIKKIDKEMANKFNNLKNISLIQELASLQVLFPPNFKFDQPYGVQVTLQEEKQDSGEKTIQVPQNDYFKRLRSNDLKSIVGVRREAKTLVFKDNKLENSIEVKIETEKDISPAKDFYDLISESMFVCTLANEEESKKIQVYEVQKEVAVGTLEYEGQITCNNGHPLKHFAADDLKQRDDGDGDTYQSAHLRCNSCSTSMNLQSDGGYYSCKEKCDYDQCKKCSVCEKGHTMKLSKGKPPHYGSLFCDRCKSRPTEAELNEGFIRCAECQYDLCRKCVPSAKSVGEFKKEDKFSFVKEPNKQLIHNFKELEKLRKDSKVTHFKQEDKTCQVSWVSISNEEGGAMYKACSTNLSLDDEELKEGSLEIKEIALKMPASDSEKGKLELLDFMTNQESTFLVLKNVTESKTLLRLSVFNNTSGDLQDTVEFVPLELPKAEFTANIVLEPATKDNIEVRVFNSDFSHQVVYFFKSKASTKLYQALTPMENLTKFDTKRAEHCERQVRTYLHQVSEDQLVLDREQIKKSRTDVSADSFEWLSLFAQILSSWSRKFIKEVSEAKTLVNLQSITLKSKLAVLQKAETFQALFRVLKLTSTLVAYLQQAHKDCTDDMKTAKESIQVRLKQIGVIYSDVRLVLVTNLHALEQSRQITLKELLTSKVANFNEFASITGDLSLFEEICQLEFMLADLTDKEVQVEANGLDFWKIMHNSFRPASQTLISLLEKSSNTGNAQTQFMTFFFEQLHADSSQVLDKQFKDLMKSEILTDPQSKFVQRYVTKRISAFSTETENQEKLACDFLEELNVMEVKNGHNGIAIQMVTLALFGQKSLLESPHVAKVIIEMLQKRSDLPMPLLRDLSWFVGRKICQLLQIEQEGVAQDNSATSLIMQSDLLSGGLQPHLFCYFSETDLKQMACDAKTGMNTDVQSYIDEALVAVAKKDEFASKFNEEDSSLRAIIHEGKDEITDQVCRGLQFKLRKSGGPVAVYCNAGQKEGMMLTRASFAVMIKFAGLAEVFEKMHYEVDYGQGLAISEEAGAKQDEDVVEAFTEVEKNEEVFKCWANATRMRRWLMRKKQSLGERYATKAEDDEKTVDDNLKKEKEEIETIFKKIVQKSEFLVSLQTPSTVFKASEPEDLQQAIMRRPSYFPQTIQPTENAKVTKIESGKSWTESLEVWHADLQDLGILKSPNDTAKKIKEAGTTSVLACLQSPISDEQIIHQVMLCTRNTIRRLSAFALINNLLNEGTDIMNLMDFVNWFISFQGNSKKLLHYTDGIKGCGSMLEEKLRKVFFSILAKFGKQLSKLTPENVDEACFILKAFECKFLARDFDKLYNEIHIFNLLFRGGDMVTKSYSLYHDDNKLAPLQTALQQTTQDVYLAIVARISESDAVQTMQIKNTGFTEVPLISRKKSILDDNVSELIVGQALNEFFRVFQQVINEKAKIAQYSGSMLLNDKTQLKCDKDHDLAINYGGESMPYEKESSFRVACSICKCVFDKDQVDPKVGFPRCAECQYDLCPTCTSDGRQFEKEITWKLLEDIINYKEEDKSVVKRPESASTESTTVQIDTSKPDGGRSLQVNVHSSEVVLQKQVIEEVSSPPPTAQGSPVQKKESAEKEEKEVKKEAEKIQEPEKKEEQAEAKKEEEKKDEKKDEKTTAEKEEMEKLAERVKSGRQNKELIALRDANSKYDEQMDERLSQFFSMIHLLLNVAQVAPYALRMLRSMSTPFHVRTLCDLFKVVSPKSKLNIIKVLNKLVENKIPSQVFTEAFQSDETILKTQKSVFSQTIENTFAKFLFEFAVSIRSVESQKAKGMYAVSKQLIQLMIRYCDKKQLETALETTMSKFQTCEQAEQNLIFEMLGSSLSYISPGDTVKYSTKILNTKLTALDNKPMTVIEHDSYKLKDPSVCFDTYAGKEIKIQVFNRTEHQFSHVYPASLAVESGNALEASVTTIKSLLAYTISEDSSDTTKTQALKFFLQNPSCLERIDDKALRKQLNTFLEKNADNKFYLEYCKKISKDGNFGNQYDMNIAVLEEHIASQAAYLADLEPMRKTYQKSDEEKKAEEAKKAEETKQTEANQVDKQDKPAEAIKLENSESTVSPDQIKFEIGTPVQLRIPMRRSLNTNLYLISQKGKNKDKKPEEEDIKKLIDRIRYMHNFEWSCIRTLTLIKTTYAMKKTALDRTNLLKVIQIFYRKIEKFDHKKPDVRDYFELALEDFQKKIEEIAFKLLKDEKDEDIEKYMEETDFTEFNKFAREIKLGDYDVSQNISQGARTQWEKFMVVSDVNWKLFKALDKNKTCLGCFKFNSDARNQLSKMDEGMPAKLLVQQLSQRLLFTLHSETNDEEISKKTFNTLLQEYRDCKMIKYRNYTFASWGSQPKKFDGNTLLAVFESRLKTSQGEMCEFIAQSMNESITQCIWKALSYLNDDTFSQDGHLYVVNCSILRKFAALLLPKDAQFDQFVVQLVDALLIHLQTFDRILPHTEKKTQGVYLLEIRKVFQILDPIFEKAKQNSEKLKEILNLESLKSTVENLPKRSRELRSLFEYLLIELVMKLKEAADKADIPNDKLAFLLAQDLFKVKELLKNQMEVKKEAESETDQDNEPSAEKLAELATQTIMLQEEDSTADMVNGWCKINLSGAKEFKLKIALKDKKEKSKEHSAIFVATSSEPCFNDTTKYHQLQGNKQLVVSQSEGTVYVKYPVETKYLLTIIQYLHRYNAPKDKFKEEITLEPFFKQKTSIESLSEHYNIDTDPIVVIGDQGAKAHLVHKDGKFSEKCSVNLPTGECIKFISRRCSNEVFNHLMIRQEGCDYYTHNDDYSCIVLTESGRLFNCPVKNYSGRPTREFPYIHSKIKKIVKVAVSDNADQLLVLDESGNLYEVQTPSCNGYYTGQTGRLTVVQRGKAKLRDGSEIKEIHNIWSTGYDYCSDQRLWILEGTTTYGQKVICSAGHFTSERGNHLGRQVTETETKNEFHILDYEHDMTTFTDISVKRGIAVAIDDTGEIWILAGKSRGFYQNVGLQIKSEDRYNGRRIARPFSTNYMFKQGLRATSIKVGEQCMLVQTEDIMTGNKGVRVIKGEKKADGDSYIQDENKATTLFKDLIKQKFENFGDKFEILDMHNISTETYEYPELIAYFILKPKATTKVALKIQSQPIVVKEKKAATTTQTNYLIRDQLLEKLNVLATEQFKSRGVYTYLQDNQSQQNFLKTFFKKFLKLPEEKEESMMAEHKMLSEFLVKYAEQHQVLYDLVPLVSYICEDPYLTSCKGGNEILQDYIEKAKLIDMEILSRIKLQKAFDNVPSTYTENKVFLDRVMAAEFKTNNHRHETAGECMTIFSQVFYALRNKQQQMKNRDQLFRSYIKGEDSYDCGGPMRDIICNMCEELMSDTLPLLIKTANNASSVEPDMDCWRLNPKATEPHVQQKLIFLGYLLGWSLFQFGTLGIDLPLSFWSRICGGFDYVYTLEDLNSLDLHRRHMMDQLIDAKQMSDEDFEAIFSGYFFEADIGDSEPVLLCEGGDEKPLTRQNVDEYVRLFLVKYTQQDALQFKLVYTGIQDVVCKRSLIHMSPTIASRRACAKSEINFKALKASTEIGDDDKEYSKWFYEVLEEFTNDQRQLFLKFMCGRTRLQQGQTQRINVLSASDTRWPLGHTCFNSMDLPRYSTKEILKERLIICITLCGEIDGDAEYMEYEPSIHSVDNDMEKGIDEESDYLLDVKNWQFDDIESVEEGEEEEEKEEENKEGDEEKKEEETDHDAIDITFRF